MILPNKRHPDYVSNDCDSALFEELCNQHWVLLHQSPPPKGLSGVKKVVCRPLSLSFPPGISPFPSIDWMLKEQTPVKEILLPSQFVNLDVRTMGSPTL